MAEALFLVVISRAAFAVTDDVDQIRVIGDRSLSLGGAILIGLSMIAIRCGLALWAAAQSSRFRGHAD